MKLKTITIGDIHGKDIWKQCADLKLLLEFPNLETEYDKYIFIGDYVDCFTHSDKEILDNLQDIILLKKNYPDHIVLLLGNHDIQYLFTFNKCGCSGFRSQMYEKLHNIFQSNRNLFQVAFQIDNYIWIHAGIHKGWYKDRFFKLIHNDKVTLAEQLNEAFDNNIDCLFDVGIIRGGDKNVGGPFWVDARNMNKSLEGYHQITGHSKVKYIKTYRSDQLASHLKDTSVTFVDCLDKTTDFYEKTIEYETKSNI